MGFFSSKKNQDISELKTDRSGPAYLAYSAKERDLAAILAKRLAKEGANVWFDQFDIELGANWDHSIEKALNEAKAFIYLLSPTSINSENALSEIRYYREKFGVDKVICVTTGNPYISMQFSRLQTVNLDDGLNETVEVLKSFLENSGIKEVEKEEREAQSKGYIFISYAEEDSNFVGIIKEFMKKQGYGYWDYRDSDRNYHTQLDNELENVIKKAEATLSILSNNWKKSDWSKKEYHFSNEIGKPVFLLKFEDMEPTLATAGIPYIDFSLNKDEGFTKLEIEFKRKNL